MHSADYLVYSSGTDPASLQVVTESIGDLRIDILAEIDRRLNRVATSAAGLASAAVGPSTGTHAWLAASRTLAALLTAALAISLLRLWRRMCQNMLRILECLGHPLNATDA